MPSNRKPSSSDRATLLGGGGDELAVAELDLSI